MNVKILGKTNCSQCTVVKKILTGKGIDYEYIDTGLSENRRYLDEAIAYGIRSLPVIIVDGEYKGIDWVKSL
jgi:glutaredoxin